MMKKTFPVLAGFLFVFTGAQAQTYPKNYFRHPLDIPMQLVSNFGEIRTNHWHMGLDIRTQQRVNLPVRAAADGYIARVSVEPGGFGQAVYINHPNGYTTLYGHLNSFFPALEKYVEEQQYAKESWQVNLFLPPGLFPVKKGQLIALSGSTGASEGPHVHFEIRDTKTENNLNPLLFRFPVTDNIPPLVSRLAVYDRNKSTYEQTPRLLYPKKSGGVYTISPSTLQVGSDKISFAVGARDQLNGMHFIYGIYSARVSVDDQPMSEFILDDISYNDTRYINAQVDYPLKSKTGASVQHISPLPGAKDIAYTLYNDDGMVHLKDTEPHRVTIDVKDAYGNVSKIQFRVQYNPQLARENKSPDSDVFLPRNVNVFEREHFELFTTEKTIYDTVTIDYAQSGAAAADAISPRFSFLDDDIPAHDAFTVRIKPTEKLPAGAEDRVIIRNVWGKRIYVSKAVRQNGWYAAKFRQFGSFEAFIDTEPPTINAPATNLRGASRIVFVPKDNFNSIKRFRAEVDGQWLRFTNDKGRTWIYHFDKYFPPGAHELKVTIEDEAGNVTTKTWQVTR